MGVGTKWRCYWKPRAFSVFTGFSLEVMKKGRWIETGEGSELDFQLRKGKKVEWEVKDRMKYEYERKWDGDLKLEDCTWSRDSKGEQWRYKVWYVIGNWCYQGWDPTPCDAVGFRVWRLCFTASTVLLLQIRQYSSKGQFTLMLIWNTRLLL
jgi:hypothetical protein